MTWILYIRVYKQVLPLRVQVKVNRLYVGTCKAVMLFTPFRHLAPGPSDLRRPAHHLPYVSPPSCHPLVVAT